MKLNLFSKLYRKAVFFGGHLHRLNSFPWLTWDRNEHLLDYADVQNALSLIRKGDIGIHREMGYASNLFIPGYFIHAWIHTNSPIELGKNPYINCTKEMKVIEAISSGVVKRSAMYPITDHTIILRPKTATPKEIDRAIDKAEKIVGCEYDFRFEFDIEEELNHFKVKEMAEKSHLHHIYTEEKQGLEEHRENLKNGWDGGFCCTEVVSFSYWHIRQKLDLHRQTARGKKVILADSFMNPDVYDIVWMSNLVTPECAEKYGMHEKGVKMIRDYRNSNLFLNNLSSRHRRIR